MHTLSAICQRIERQDNRCFEKFVAILKIASFLQGEPEKRPLPAGGSGGQDGQGGFELWC